MKNNNIKEKEASKNNENNTKENEEIGIEIKKNETVKENVENIENNNKDSKDNKDNKVKKDPKDKIIKYIKITIRVLLNILFTIIIATSIVQMSNSIEDSAYFEYHELEPYIDTSARLCILIAIGLYFGIRTIAGKSRRSFLILAISTYIFDLVNTFIYKERGIKTAISDIFSLRTAINVAKGTQIRIDKAVLITTGFLIITIALIYLLKIKELDKTKPWQRIIYAVISFICIFYVYRSSYFTDHINLWNLNNSYNYEGTYLTVMKQIQTLKVHKPEGYSEKEVEALLKKYKINYSETDIENKPNIIVILDESFADLYGAYNLGNRDPIPYTRKLMKSENVQSGTMYSSAFGGLTGNIEYEVVTQNSVGILPVNAIAYNQFVKENRDTFVTHMKNLGYETYAMHSWHASGYSRKRIYQTFGFDNISFLEDYDDWELIQNQNYPTDKSTFEKVVDQLNNKSEKPIFSLVVTMQNHRPYDTPDDNIQDFCEDNELNVYLEGLNKTDKAIKYLIESLEEYEEDTIVLLFGDHLPRIDLMSEEIDKDNVKKWEVPYFIWANYDIEEKYDQISSPIFFQNQIMDIAKLPKSDYTNYLSNLNKTLKAITNSLYIDNKNNVYQLSDDNIPYRNLYKEYTNVAYYQMMK